MGDGWYAIPGSEFDVCGIVTSRLKPNAAPRVLFPLPPPPTLTAASPPLTSPSLRVSGRGGDGQIRGGSGCGRKIGDIEA